MVEREFSVSGMHCQSCVALIKDELADLDGVASSEVDLAGGRARVAYDPDRVTETQIVAAIQLAGYQAVPA